MARGYRLPQLRFDQGAQTLQATHRVLNSFAKLLIVTWAILSTLGFFTAAADTFLARHQSLQHDFEPLMGELNPEFDVRFGLAAAFTLSSQ
ncbi:hypothetical protein [Phaeobacter inhibens]|uniref:hypothetical protein n=1 Tax=Phaeobacter inhibens TaxID=221822 RepID=UPI00076BAFC6|nr:hypothetical protein [Phaeobacter inhibens]KXF92120.1 hypothetical protein AT574_03970 [Phaeobacter inhibens]WHP69955.1 hypothetical protein QMZ01_07215 [Phaeobacter inhibens]